MPKGLLDMAVGKSQPNRGGFLEYLEGGSWKCGKSPTGAHHWEGIEGRRVDTLACKYCHQSKLFHSEVFQSPLPGEPLVLLRLTQGMIPRILPDEVRAEW